MKNKIILIILALHCAAFAQTPLNPLATDSNARVNRSFNVPSGKTLTIDSGGALTLSSGSTITISGTLTLGTVLPVASGGTGVSTLTTAYGLTAAGTTATGPMQTLPAGLTTQILVGGGAGALPVWTTATGTGAPVRQSNATFTESTIFENAYADGFNEVILSGAGSGFIGLGFAGTRTTLYGTASEFDQDIYLPDASGTLVLGDGTGVTNAAAFRAAIGAGVGTGDMVLATGFQVVTGSKLFSDDTLVLNGLSSGTVTLHANATAGTGSVTFPTGTVTLAARSDNLSVFAATSSASLAGVVSDETGTGALVFGTSPRISAIELGHATDTTITRTASGQIAVEGISILTANSSTFNAVPIRSNSSGINIGAVNIQTGSSAVLLGSSSTVSGDYSVGVGYLTHVAGASGTAIGYRNSADGLMSNAVGYYNSATVDYASAFGFQVQTTVMKVQELGYWSDLSTRGGAVRVHGATGMVAVTVQDTATAYTDGGATHGAEADGTIPRKSFAIRRDGQAVFLDMNNSAGVVTTVPITSPHSEASLDFPNITVGDTEELVIYLTEAEPGDYVTLATPVDRLNGLIVEAWVSASGEVTVRATNVSAVGLDPDRDIYGVKISHP